MPSHLEPGLNQKKATELIHGSQAALSKDIVADSKSGLESEGRGGEQGAGKTT